MGRASRRKHERRKMPPALSSIATSPTVQLWPPTPRTRCISALSSIATSPTVQPREGHLNVIYKFFHDPSHADALASGKVWLSTLETCRGYEDPKQGDSEEGLFHYNSGHAVGNSGDKGFELVAARSGIHIGSGCINGTISYCSMAQRLPDAFVFCTTELFDPKHFSKTFGMYCVEISNPQRFFILITDQLRQVHEIAEAEYGPVIYKDRYYTGLQHSPGPIGFVKPPDKYKDQHEFRLQWKVHGSFTLKPFLLEVPSAATLCRRVA